MKKIYLLTFAMVALGFGAMAQPSAECPATLHPENLTVPLTPTFCKLVISGGPGTDVNGNLPVVYLYSATGLITLTNGLNHGFLNATGQGTFEYPCQTIVMVEINWYTTPTHVAECTFTPPPAASLPIKLTSFNGRLKNDNSVTLDWASQMEVDSYQYEIQRSTDGKYFEKVGSLKAAGISLDALKYTFEDKLPSAGGFFYRLKQIDIDGKYEYSKVVYVNSKKGSGVVSQIFPNPFKGEIQLIGATSSDLTPNNIHVFSINGQRVQYKVMGANSIMIDPSAPDGIYILKVKGQTFKLVKSQSSGTAY